MQRFHAPSVSYPAGRFAGRAGRWLWRAAVWASPAPGWLTWSDGRDGLATPEWQWSDERGERVASLTAVYLTWRLPHALLLRCQAPHGEDAPRWLWVSRRSAPGRWHALLCALTAHAEGGSQDGVVPRV